MQQILAVQPRTSRARRETAAVALAPPASRDTRPSRERRAVHAARHRQRVRRRDGRHGAQRFCPRSPSPNFTSSPRSAILSFIVVFGLTKAVTNYAAGRLSDRLGRKRMLVAGWLVAVPVPFLLMWAPTWTWVLVANALLGVSQGLTWSTTVIMKIDLVGAERRGLAMGLNEFAGYGAMAGSAWATGWIAARSGTPTGAVLSRRRLRGRWSDVVVAVRAGDRRSCRPRGDRERRRSGRALSARDVFWRTSVADRNLSSVSQAGLVNNLNDGMAWGLFPLVFAAAGMNLGQIGVLAAIYPATWGVGAARDRRVVRPDRPKVADCLRHVGAGRRDRRDRRRTERLGLRDRGRAARPGHRDGVSDAARGDWRRRVARVAGVVDRRLPPVAGFGISPSARC